MAATIQHTPEGNILRTVPGFETLLPARFRSCDTACEHCNTDRIRKDTYVLQAEAGEWKQVGRNCLADFLRTGDASGWCEMAEILASLAGEMEGFEDGGEFACGEHTGYPMAALLAQVACIVRQDGWCSRKEAKDAWGAKCATVDLTLDFFSKTALEHDTCEVCDAPILAGEDFDRCCGHVVHYRCLPVFTVYRHFTIPVPRGKSPKVKTR
jgi:hypothetical protein